MRFVLQKESAIKRPGHSRRAETPLHKQPERIKKHKKGEGIYNIIQLKGFSSSEKSRIPEPVDGTVSDGDGRLSPEGKAIERWASKGGLQQSQDSHLNVSDDEKDQILAENNVYYNIEGEEESEEEETDGASVDNASYITPRMSQGEEEERDDEDDGLMNVRMNTSRYEAHRAGSMSRATYDTIDEDERGGKLEHSDPGEDDYVELSEGPATQRGDREPTKHEIDKLYKHMGQHKKIRRVRKQREDDGRPGTQ